MTDSPLERPEWLLPRGVSRSLWEYAHDPRISQDDPAHLAGSALLDLEERLMEQWLGKPDDLVDLGCGPGRRSLPLARRGFRILAVDLSPEAVSQVRRQANAEGLEIAAIRANLCELDCLPDRMFGSALLLFGTLGMVRGAGNRGAVLSHAFRILRPGGQLVLHAHNVWRHLWEPSTRWWLLGDRWKRLRGDDTAGDTRRDYRGIPGMYHHAFSFTELHRLLQEAGFRVADVVPFDPDSPLSTSRGWWNVNVRCAGWIVRAIARPE